MRIVLMEATSCTVECSTLPGAIRRSRPEISVRLLGLSDTATAGAVTKGGTNVFDMRNRQVWSSVDDPGGNRDLIDGRGRRDGDPAPEIGGGRRPLKNVSNGIRPSGGATETAPPDSGGNRWYVVHTHPHREARAARQLAYQGFGVYLPQRFKTRRHARKIDTVLVAYFPQYLFVEFDIDRDRWRSVNGTFGVRHLVMRGEVPEPVPSELVRRLMARTDAAGILCLRDAMKDGQPVEVTGGPFADLVGTLETLNGSDRVRVLLDILGGVKLTLPRNSVAPVSR